MDDVTITSSTKECHKDHRLCWFMTIISLTRPASCHRFFVLDVSISDWLILLTYVTDFSIEYRRAPIERYVGMTLLTIRLA